MNSPRTPLRANDKYHRILKVMPTFLTFGFSREKELLLSGSRHASSCLVEQETSFEGLKFSQ